MTITRQFLVFIVVGGASALIDTALMQMLVLYGVALWFAVATGFAAGLAVNYLSHARFTFGTGLTWRNGIRFAAIVTFNYALTLGFVDVAQSLVGSALVGKVISLPFVALTGFTASRMWVFK